MSPYDHFAGEQPTTRTLDQAITDYSIEPETLIEYSENLHTSLSHFTDLSLHAQLENDTVDAQTLKEEIEEVDRQIIEDATIFAQAIQNFSIHDDTTGAEMAVPPSFGDVYLLANAVDATGDADLTESLGHILLDTPPAHSGLLRTAYLSSRKTGNPILTEHRKLDIIEADVLEAYEAGAQARAAEAEAAKDKARRERWAATLLARAAMKQTDNTQ